MIRRIKTIRDVVEWGLCTGCGACAYACDRGGITLVNLESVGIRPQFDSQCASCTQCLAVCPGHSVPASATPASYVSNGAGAELGPILEIWEGYAADPEIRFRASSGGILSALALYCLEKEDMAFVLHAAMDNAKPWANKTVMSKDRNDLLSRSGSRYAPSSPCEGLRALETSDRPGVFIGKPCDAAAVAKAAQIRPQLRRNLGLSLTFFCAGTPSTRGTLDLLQQLQVDAGDVRAVRYRGEGWPGKFQVCSSNGTDGRSLSYEESWGRLAAYRPWRCHLCPDGLGESADISCGDAWERFDGAQDPGRSIVIVRTERGRQVLQRAMAAAYVVLEPVTPQAVISAQAGLLQRRKELFGRLLAMKLLLLPAPSFESFQLFRSWVRLPLYRRFKTIVGTLRRLLLRGLWRRQHA